jgi:acetylornithine deacetylase/succinyl-diaminopimelate desuccinylase-like protein
MAWDPTGETVELLQTMIRSACVNEGTVESGQEVRNADAIEAFLDGSGLDVERVEAAPGRVSLIVRIEGRDPDAPSLCLDGHTDVVPVNEDGWSRDPFGGELVDGEVWGRGAVDMLNLTASYAVVLRRLAATGFRPRGDLVFVAVADEESGSTYGARHLAEHHRDVMATDFVLTENGGLHGGQEREEMRKHNAWRMMKNRDQMEKKVEKRTNKRMKLDLEPVEGLEIVPVAVSEADDVPSPILVPILNPNPNPTPGP